MFPVPDTVYGTFICTVAGTTLNAQLYILARLEQMGKRSRMGMRNLQFLRWVFLVGVSFWSSGQSVCLSRLTYCKLDYSSYICR